ncbi:efflux RND transporter permease subunit [Burkholderia thailandensis]|uniref:efflux RND transporter permease subunit n=1 Tax=Burkholderia thailandensis TaxID=57975 RepID=UPI0003ECACAB|nr:efflux RND transporter permease subunit [Burkholderia thailandensis]AHI64391.1 acrB/AcrD/AcrF family protein [Burkholderia thailandensis H0587]AOJ52212.1 RND transporter [Burkholderia thailandensis]AVR24566.1 AcrB/AcrD/AcrF family protein [Burkholderia thailandensis]MCZ2903259.1 efflux RND transporter permease subunit [Burkholderia thailandensis]MDD1484034.1 efflux RND transporter permease subunit [Burkholderia thailandensis]
MLKIVRLALIRPYTFIVLAMLILIAGPLSALRTPTDIFPDIRIPVISVVWSYAGLQPDDMAGRIVTYYERTLGTTVNDVQHIESQSFRGYGIVKIFFQPTVDIRTATAQVTSVSQTVLKQMPPGTTPPQILNYNASTVPVLQIALTSDTLDEQKLADYAANFIRPQLLSVPGVAIPTPYGGKTREVQIDLDPQALQAKKLSAQDVATALAQQNQIIPAGTQKIGRFEYNIKLNNSPLTLNQLNALPIKSVDGATIAIRDVAHVRDGYPPQSNIVRVDGHRAVLMSILKNGSASTLDIIAGVKAKLPLIEKTLPAGLKLVTMGDQSTFVKGAVSGVAREGAIAAALTSLMILLFLGSWRSTLIIAASIPLAVLAAIAALAASGETLNVMTLGGLALAVGILVDDATVTIENVNWHLEQGKDVRAAIMDGAMQIVTPAFVSLLCICIVFVPMLLLDGIARFLFVPMAKAVIFAMIASFALSRTFVPMLAQYLLRPHASQGHASGELAALMAPHGAHPQPSPSGNPLVRFQRGFERRFERARAAYRIALGLALTHRKRFLAAFGIAVAASFALAPWLGRNFFPDIDAGEIALHVRAPIGTRIEDTAAEFDRVENVVRRVIPPDQLKNVIDNIGLPNSGINLTYNNSGTTGAQDGDILISLGRDHAPTADYVRKLREILPRAFAGSTFSFLPADIVSQILNFGAPAPIDVQVAGPDQAGNRRYANELFRRIRRVAGIADTRVQQAATYPQFTVSVNRTRADELGITEQDVTNSVVASLSGTSQVAPAYWLDPRNGVSYPIVAQTPQYRMTSLSNLRDLPVTGKNGQSQILGGLATIERGVGNAVVSHYDIEPLFDVYATTQGRDLGAVAADIRKIVDATSKDLPKGSTVTLRGQVQTMNSAFSGLLFGLAGAIALIYLLIVVNFHSWSDAFVIVSALPAALAGIVWMLFATHTPLSVPALTGAILCMGVATANSILVVSFARERLATTGNAMVAALEAGFTRFRPVLMTALAMIIGMAPMALGLGDGGEQNAPLGRAVIGGLVCATFATLLLVPVVFSLVHRRDTGLRERTHESSPSASGVTHVQ